MVTEQERTREKERLYKLYLGVIHKIGDYMDTLQSLCQEHDWAHMYLHWEIEDGKARPAQHTCAEYDVIYNNAESKLSELIAHVPMVYPIDYRQKKKWEAQVDRCEAIILGYLSRVECLVFQPIQGSLSRMKGALSEQSREALRRRSE